MKEIVVSVVMPTRNEVKHIDLCLMSLLKQTFPREKMEILLVDGQSNDRTIDILNRYAGMYKELFVVKINPKKAAPAAMNIGIKSASGKFIVRVDAHSEYPPDYIEKCIHYLSTIDADNVGGLFIVKGKGLIGEAFAGVLSSRFGVGNAGFRTYAVSGYTDTVPYGAFRKEVFEKYGIYDERLIRNQDYELNYRIRKGGGKVYLANDVRLTDYCKNDLLGIASQSFSNGKWNIITSRLCPGTMSIRHFVPFIFVFSVVFLLLLMLIAPKMALLLLSSELILYAMIDIIVSIGIAARSRLKHLPVLIVLFPWFHISYGIGSLLGLMNLKKVF